jgi:ribosomal protein S18 acetylase RimI-like enzyme
MTLADLSDVSSIHLICFSYNRSTLLGKRFVLAEYRWFLKYFPELAWVYENDFKIAGFIVGATSEYWTKLLNELWLMVIQALLFHPWLVFNRSIWTGVGVYIKDQLINKLIGRKPKKKPDISPPHEKSFSLASIAVDPEMRGYGIASHLIRAFENQAIALGGTKLRLSVFNDNLSASTVYEKAGWKKIDVRANEAKYEKELAH